MTLKANPNDSSCTAQCLNHPIEACGGPVDTSTLQPTALSLYDSAPPVPVTFSGWKYNGCVAHMSSVVNFTHVSTLTEVTVEGCLLACDGAGLAYKYAGLSGM